MGICNPLQRLIAQAYLDVASLRSTKKMRLAGKYHLLVLRARAIAAGPSLQPLADEIEKKGPASRPDLSSKQVRCLGRLRLEHHVVRGELVPRLAKQGQTRAIRERDCRGMVRQRLELGQAGILAAGVEDLNLIANTRSEFAAEDRVMASKYRAKLVDVVPGSTKEGIVVGESCRDQILTAVKLIVSIAAVELVVPKLPVEEIVILVAEQKIIPVEADDEIRPDAAEDDIVSGPAA